MSGARVRLGERGWWLGAGGGLGIAVSLFGYKGRDPYSCLYRYPHKVLILTPHSGSTSKVLVYSPADAPKLLRDMKNELTPAQGFDFENNSRDGYLILDFMK